MTARTCKPISCECFHCSGTGTAEAFGQEGECMECEGLGARLVYLDSRGEFVDCGAIVNWGEEAGK